MFKWNMQDITTEQDLLDMIKTFKEVKPEIGGFDTEGSGLHIVLDKPFLFHTVDSSAGLGEQGRNKIYTDL
jgi:hypothetical protein